MKYWRWKCNACGCEITILAGVVPKPCRLCATWDFLKLGETNDQHAEATKKMAILDAGMIIADPRTRVMTKAQKQLLLDAIRGFK